MWCKVSTNIKILPIYGTDNIFGFTATRCVQKYIVY